MFDKEFNFEALIDHLVKALKSLVLGILQVLDWGGDKTDAWKEALGIEDETEAE